MERPKFDPAREREFVSRGWWRSDTLPKWLSHHAAVRSDAAALVDGQRKWTWRELEARVLRAANGLKRRGVATGDVVAVQLPNVAEFVVVYLAICRLGAGMCPLHMLYRRAEIDPLLAHGRAKLLLSSAEAVTELENAEPLGEHPEPEAADAFLLLYTSGTTASPKGVVHPYRTILANARLGAPEHRLGAADRILCPAPFTHLYGLYSLHCAWAVGACTVLLPAFKPPDLCDAVEKLKPTALWTAPAHVAACRAAGLFEKRDWSSLRLAIVSGSSAPPELVKSFAAKV